MPALPKVIRRGALMPRGRIPYNSARLAATVYARVKRPERGDLLLSQSEGIKALCRLQELTCAAFGSEVPPGCVVATVDETCDIFLLVKGLVNVDEEVRKLEQQLDKARKSQEQLKKQAAMPEYVTKIPEHVRQQNEQKVRCPEPDHGIWERDGRR